MSDVTDIIAQALEESTRDKERFATGVVEQHDVKLIKTKYRDRQRVLWKVTAKFDDNSINNKKTSRLSSVEAEKAFEHLATKYNLTERNL